MTVAPPAELQLPALPAPVLAALLDAVGPAGPISPRPRWGDAAELGANTRGRLRAHGILDADDRPRPPFADIARVILDPHSVVDLRFWSDDTAWSLRGVLADSGGVAVNETADDVVISGPVSPGRIGDLVAELLPGTALELDPGVELDTHLPVVDALVLATIIQVQRTADDGAVRLTPTELAAAVRTEAVGMRPDDLRLATRVIGGIAAPPEEADVAASADRLATTGIIERTDDGVAATPALVAVAAFLGPTAPGWRWQRATRHEPDSSTWTDLIVLLGAGGLQLRIVPGSTGHVVIQTARPRDLTRTMAAEIALLHRPPGLDREVAATPERVVAAAPPPTVVTPVAAASPPTAPPAPAGRGRRGLVLALALLVALAAGAGALFLLGDDDAEPASTTTVPVTAPTTTLTPATSTTPPTTTTASPSTTSTTTTTTTTTVALVAVPAVVGLDAADAETALTDAGLVVEVVEQETGEEPAGTVLAVDPPDTTELAPGSTVTLTVAVAPPAECNDVPEPLPPSTASDIDGLGAEGRAAIAWGQAVGLIGAGDARPDDPMTRGATATVVWRYFCEPAAATPAGYTDVSPDAFYAPAADWAAAAGLITGVDASTFDPDGTVTRGQFVTIAWRATGSPLPLGRAPFDDIDENAFYADALDWAFTTGLVSGVTETTFDPQGALDRRTSLVLMYRLETIVDPAVG